MSISRRSTVEVMLRQTALFHGLAEPEVARLAEGAIGTWYSRGEPIVRDGGGQGWALLFMHGQARAYRLLPNNRVSTLFLTRPGDPLPTVPTKTSITALADHTATIRLRPDALLRVERSSPILGERIETQLSQRLTEAYDLIEDLMGDDLRTRLAHLLARLTERDGDVVTMTREDLGSMTGDSRQAVTAALSSFLAEGWIDYPPRARQIRVTNRRALRAPGKHTTEEDQ